MSIKGIKDKYKIRERWIWGRRYPSPMSQEEESREGHRGRVRIKERDELLKNIFSRSN